MRPHCELQSDFRQHASFIFSGKATFVKIGSVRQRKRKAAPRAPSVAAAAPRLRVVQRLLRLRAFGRGFPPSQTRLSFLKREKIKRLKSRVKDLSR